MSEARTSSRPARALRWARRELVPSLAMVVLLLAARSSFANHYVVPTGSMEPTLRPGDRVAVDMSAYGVRLPFTDVELVARGRPRAGDVAVFDAPDDGTRLIKRVVAVAGDVVELRDGRLVLDGVPLHTPEATDVERFGARQVVLGLDAGGGPDIRSMRIPPGKVLVLGDHRGNSRDGRFFGLVDERTIYGRASAVYFRRGQGFVWSRL